MVRSKYRDHGTSARFGWIPGIFPFAAACANFRVYIYMESMDNSAAEQLRSIIERIERLEEEKTNIASDIKDIYGEAKSMGYDVKIIRKVISLRKKQPHELEEEEQLLSLYRMAVGV